MARVGNAPLLLPDLRDLERRHLLVVHAHGQDLRVDAEVRPQTLEGHLLRDLPGLLRLLLQLLILLLLLLLNLLEPQLPLGLLPLLEVVLGHDLKLHTVLRRCEARGEEHRVGVGRRVPGPRSRAEAAEGAAARPAWLVSRLGGLATRGEGGGHALAGREGGRHALRGKGGGHARVRAGAGLAGLFHGVVLVLPVQRLVLLSLPLLLELVLLLEELLLLGPLLLSLLSPLLPGLLALLLLLRARPLGVLLVVLQEVGRQLDTALTQRVQHALRRLPHVCLLVLGRNACEGLGVGRRCRAGGL
mmetsp:Transcript_34439/g.93311  ORF Transcript_34439/g.93311 Transcript_34439/m.93311 type:complete len:302 (+) Transcript_34439:519-1424(+)